MLEIWVVRERLSYPSFIILLNNSKVIDQIHFVFLTDCISVGNSTTSSWKTYSLQKVGNIDQPQPIKSSLHMMEVSGVEKQIKIVCRVTLGWKTIPLFILVWDISITFRCGYWFCLVSSLWGHRITMIHVYCFTKISASTSDYFKPPSLTFASWVLWVWLRQLWGRAAGV